MQRHHLFHVLVLLPLSSAAGRKKLNGIHRFLNEGHDWDLELVRSDKDLSDQWTILQRAKYDGILASTSDARLIGNLRKTFDVPCAFIAYPLSGVLGENPYSVFVIDNEKAIAHAAVGHFTVECHPRTLAYVPTRAKTFWSDRRQQAFADELATRHRTLHVFSGDGESRDELTAWIRALPKPAGILAAYDDRGRDVIGMCRAADIQIPKDVSVLGIGNDEPVCEMTAPKLSSISVDFETQGYRAARELQAMMIRKRRPVQRTILCGTREVVIRESTAVGKSDSLTARALDFINRHSAEGITPEDVIRHVNVSRSLAYLRFRETLGVTILDAILEKRLGEVKRLLETTGKPIGEIANLCGYRDANYLKNQFRRKYGLSMRDWRKNAEGTNAGGTPGRS